MQHPDEGIIHAWIDGALGVDEARAIELHVANCANCAAAVAGARGLIAASSRIVGHLDAVSGGIIPAARPRKRAIWSRSAWPAAIAATLVAGIGIYSMGGRTASELAVESIPIQRTTEGAEVLAALDSADPGLAPRAREVDRAPRGEAPPTVGPARVTRSAVQDGATARPDSASGRAMADVPSVPPQVANSSPPVPVAGAGAVSREALTSASAKSADAVPVRATTAPIALPPDSSRMGIQRGAVGGTARALSAPSAGLATGIVPDAAFVGCYEMDASADILPPRFALLADSAPGSGGYRAVAYVDASQRITDRVVDANWSVENGLAVVRQARRGIVLTITRAGLAVTGETPNGPRSARVLGCSR